MAIVVDTDVVSFLFKRDTRAPLYESKLDGEIPIISFMTVAELERWTISSQWADQRHTQLMKYLQRYLVEPSSAELCRRWAEVMELGRRAEDLLTLRMLGSRQQLWSMECRS